MFNKDIHNEIFPSLMHEFLCGHSLSKTSILLDTVVRDDYSEESSSSSQVCETRFGSEAQQDRVKPGRAITIEVDIYDIIIDAMAVIL